MNKNTHQINVSADQKYTFTHEQMEAYNRGEVLFMMDGQRVLPEMVTSNQQAMCVAFKRPLTKPPKPVENPLMTTIFDAVDKYCCEKHNNGADLLGNTQEDDLNWLASSLFQASTLGAGDVRTVDWLIGEKQWEELGLKKASAWTTSRFENLTAEQQDAWRKLARIVFYILPAFAERVGNRYMQQAKAAREVWNELRKETK